VWIKERKTGLNMHKGRRRKKRNIVIMDIKQRVWSGR
jgi:hypothetical protein